MSPYLLFILSICWMLVMLQATASIKVQLLVPKIVLEGSSPTLVCWYDIGGKPLYSVKWYRGQYEFFRFVPQAEPPLVAFPLGGINIDTIHSNATQVTLKNVPKYISGKVSCEVSVDETFKTATDSANLTIIDIRIRKPYLNVSSNKLFPIEDLRVTCSAEQTDPPPLINFYIDNAKVSRSMITDMGNGKASLNSSILLPFTEQNHEHISPVWLRCDSYVGGVYHLSSASVPIIPQHPRDQSSSTCEIHVSYFLLFCISLTNLKICYS